MCRWVAVATGLKNFKSNHLVRIVCVRGSIFEIVQTFGWQSRSTRFKYSVGTFGVIGACMALMMARQLHPSGGCLVGKSHINSDSDSKVLVYCELYSKHNEHSGLGHPQERYSWT